MLCFYYNQSEKSALTAFRVHIKDENVIDKHGWWMASLWQMNWASFDLTEADGRAAVIAWGKRWLLECPEKARPTSSLSATHTHTHSCIYAVIESFCYCGAQGNVFLFLSVARIPFLLCLKQRMWLFFSFAQNLFQVETERERERREREWRREGAVQKMTK